jgi:hypothetical protein
MEDKIKELTKRLNPPILKYNEMLDIIIYIIEHKSIATAEQVK